MAGQGTDSLDPTEILYCVNHPKRETLIRCSKCLDPICSRCAILTPVGYRCPKCAKRGRSPLYSLALQHYLVAVLVALSLSIVAGAVMAQVGWLLSIVLAAVVGGLVAEAVMRSIHGRRGLAVQIITGICIVLGAMIGPWVWVALVSDSLTYLPASPLPYLASLLRLNMLIYVAIAVSSAVVRLR